jgi:hypothetical protein
LFHNFTGYDSHFIAQALKGEYGAVNFISNNRESFKCLSLRRTVPQQLSSNNIYDSTKVWRYDLSFVDSLAFCKGSLEVLFKNLDGNHKYTSNYLESVTKELGSLEKCWVKRLLSRKGAYPYEWLTEVEKFNQPMFVDNKFTLSPSDFKSSLSYTENCVEQCRLAETLCRLLQFKTFKEYHDLYNRMDVFLLTDVFENFRDVCLEGEMCGLDPCHYMGIPGLVYDSFKKGLEHDVELFTQPNQYRKFRRLGMRGGISYWARYYTEARPGFFIVDEDATSLYPYAARLLLPVGNFDDYSFTGDNMWEFIENFIFSPTHERGAYFIVDLELPVRMEEWSQRVPRHYQRYKDVIKSKYSGDLHDWCANYPVLVENKEIPSEWLHPGQRERYDRLGGHKPCKKLITDLHPKKEFLCHYLTLRLAIETGWVPTKLHWVMEFDQDKPIRNFMDHCSRLRGEATSTQMVQFYKDMMNSLVGKTIENVESFSEFRAFGVPGTQGNKYDKLRDYELSGRLNMGWRIVNEELVIGEVQRRRCSLNKPISLGIAVYDLSKILMGHLWYFLQSWYGKKVQLCGTDTDSLIFCVETEDFNQDKIAMNQHSVYPEDHPFYEDSRFSEDVTKELESKGIDWRKGIFDLGESYKKKVPGFFNPDMDNITEVAACRSKMYGARTHNPHKDWVKISEKWELVVIDNVDVLKAKGLPKSYVSERKRFEEYKESVLGHGFVGEEEAKELFVKLSSKNHRITVQTNEKVGIRAVDDKRWSADNLTTLPFGHWRTFMD